MTIQIKSIHLFNKAAERRSLNFKLNEVNIITGRSGTGKSAVIDIIDYCLGSRECNVAAGVVRQTVSYYALEIQSESGILLIGRAAPADGHKTSTQMHLSYRPADAEPPDLNEMTPNSDVDSAIGLISRLIGIDQNQTEVLSGTRVEFDVTIRHALFFCIQDQGEVASREVLFHNQGEEYRRQTIRDVLPYFLGAVDPLYIMKRQRLAILQRELRMLNRRDQDERALAEIPGRAAMLLSEAVALGLTTEPVPLDRASALQALATALTADPEPQLPVDRVDELVRLLDLREGLRGSFTDNRVELRRLRKLVRYGNEYTGEAGERRGRLQSLDLLKIPADRDAHTSTCPLCSSELEDPVTSVGEIREQLNQVIMEIAGVRQDLPRLQTVIADYEEKLRQLGAELSNNQEQIDQVAESIDTFEAMREAALQRAAVRGRISLFLEATSRETDAAIVASRAQELRDQISELESELDPELTAERLNAALSRVDYVITQVANRLGLEHAPSPVRLDIRALTIVVDTAYGSYRLREIGSGENWLGYHLASLIGLHTHFIENRRPVPRLLILDQPSQVYFPPDASDSSPLGDADHESLTRAFNELFSLVEGAETGFQMIVMEHADLADKRFQGAIVERWRDEGKALIPDDWLT